MKVSKESELKLKIAKLQKQHSAVSRVRSRLDSFVRDISQMIQDDLPDLEDEYSSVEISELVRNVQDISTDLQMTGIDVTDEIKSAYGELDKIRFRVRVYETSGIEEIDAGVFETMDEVVKFIKEGDYEGAPLVIERKDKEGRWYKTFNSRPTAQQRASWEAEASKSKGGK